MDNSFFEENNTIVVSFCNKNLWRNSIRTKREVKKFERKGFYLSDETYIVTKKGYTSTLVFVKNQ